MLCPRPSRLGYVVLHQPQSPAAVFHCERLAFEDPSQCRAVRDERELSPPKMGLEFAHRPHDRYEITVRC